MARRLQNGDPDGLIRRALDHFPVPEVAQRILDRYFIAGGKGDDEPYKSTPVHTLEPSIALDELTVAGNFVEVFLAKAGHDGPVERVVAQRIVVGHVALPLEFTR